jgi:hypothetical protein
MRWNHVAVSAVGSEHARHNTGCEDRSVSFVVTQPDGSSILCLFVSDGAGSAKRGAVGAQIATQAASDFMQKYEGEPFVASASVGNQILIAVRNAIRQNAAAGGFAVRDFACTFQSVVVHGSGTVMTHVGDGVIVSDVGGVREVNCPPVNGEFVNETHFVTDDNLMDNPTVKVFDGVPSEVFSLSDGAAVLGVVYGSGALHGRFFDRVSEALASVPEDELGLFAGELFEFLVGDHVNALTKDDKSVAAAVLIR